MHVKKPRSSRQVFSLFSKVDNKYSHSQEDSNSNIIWQDCANVHARLVFCCSNMRYMYMKVPKSHNWYKQFGLSLHLYPFFKCNQRRLWRDCANVHARLVFAARIWDKYLNHITGINNLASAFIYIPSFYRNQRRLWRDCANVQPRQITRCSHM